MPVKDWMLAKNGDQFQFINHGCARRFIDGEVFVAGLPYLHNSSSLPEYTIVFEIDKFDVDKVHVHYTVRANYGESIPWSNVCKMNDIVVSKITDEHGTQFKSFHVSENRSPRRARRRVVPKKKL